MTATRIFPAIGTKAYWEAAAYAHAMEVTRMLKLGFFRRAERQEREAAYCLKRAQES